MDLYLLTQELEADSLAEEVWGYIEQGDNLVDDGEFEAALDAYNQAIELDPELALAYEWRGWVYHELDDIEAAFEDYNRAIDLCRECSVPYYNRALIYDEWDDDEAALADYLRYLELVEDIPEEEYIDYARERVEALGGNQPD